MHRLYENNDITVFWNSDKCRHAKRCVTGSPDTFNIQRKPWIDVTIAPTAEIWQAVSACPSGALTCVYTHNVAVELHEDESRSVAYAASGESGAGTGADRIQIGECDYRDTPEGRVIYHTEVDPDYGEKGIARRLVYKVIESAERAGLKIIPTCSYAAKVVEE